MRNPRRLFLFVPGLLLTFLPAVALADRPVSFNQQIQPILSEYCYQCHGPDASTRKPKNAPLRLDAEQFAFATRGDAGPAILKGDPANSPIMQRIRSTDPDDIMPPPESHKQLKPEEKALLERWINEGGKYESHWSYLPPVKPPLPPATGPGLTEIDRFIAAGLAQSGLAFNPPETRARAFRRLAYDLTGLPPDVPSLLAYLGDTSPDAWEKAADRLLATDPSAEHFARQWLDAVRYGDTHGIHIDNYRSIWPYRDWVIRAFQTNQPFDQFTIEQMAGDLLPNATTDQKIATGYNRCMPTTGEGGAIGEEYDAVYAKDRADTMGAVWLGLTVGCASCHDHKFDPIPTKDFYALTAFFRNTPMSSLDGNNAEHPPVLEIPTKDQETLTGQLTQKIAQQEKDLGQRRGAARQEFDAWLAVREKTPPEAPAAAPLKLHLPLNEATRLFHGTSMGQPAALTEVAAPIDPLSDSAPVASGQIVTGEIPVIERAGKATISIRLRNEQNATGSLLSRMDAAKGLRGWDLWLEKNRPMVHIIDTWPGKALKVTAKKPLDPKVWHTLTVVFDGTKAGPAAVSLYADGVLLPVDAAENTLGPDISTAAPLRVGSRSHGDAADSVLTPKTAVSDIRLYDAALTDDEVRVLALQLPLQRWLATAGAARTPAQKDELFGYYAAAFDKQSQQLQAGLDTLQQELKQLRKAVVKTLVMVEKPEAPSAFVLSRGDYRKKADRVTADSLTALPPMAPDAPKNRLGLAKWLVSQQNPLTARVTVNRVWSYLFGTGIVETTEDLGISGARPVNQDLLDWQAVTFMESGWDYRAMVKRMVLSHAYRQAATATPEKLEKDPLNLLNSRGPRYRLDAEQIRDGALSAAGLLIPTIGGPPVRPYQPDGVWEAVAMPQSNTRQYTQDSGEALYRRSMYTLWKRTAPPASMDILNAPSRETFCTRRERTNTPLQAFVIMNDPQFVEAARQLATRAVLHSPGKEARLDFISCRILSRDFTGPERATVFRTLGTFLTKYQADPAAAAALTAVGDSKPDPAIAPAELAAWTLAVSQVMNMDEALTK